MTHSFVNKLNRKVNDLHITYTDSIMDVNPDISVPNTGFSLSSDKKTLDIKFANALDNNDVVIVTVYSMARKIEINNYQWSDANNQLIGPRIPLYYLSVKSNKKGEFTLKPPFGLQKPENVVLVEYRNKINVISVQEDVKPNGASASTISFDGKATPGKNGQFVAWIDPPDEVYELIIDIIPEEDFGAIAYSNRSYGGASLSTNMVLILAIFLIGISFKYISIEKDKEKRQPK